MWFNEILVIFNIVKVDGFFKIWSISFHILPIYFWNKIKDKTSHVYEPLPHSFFSNFFQKLHEL